MKQIIYFYTMEYFKNSGFILRMAIAVGYCLLALFLFLHPEVLTFLSKEMSFAFGGVILIYGLFRAYRAYAMFKEEQDAIQ